MSKRRPPTAEATSRQGANKFGAQKHYIALNDIDVMDLYRELESITVDRSEREGGYLHPKDCLFSEEEVQKALTAQGVALNDLPQAIDHCVTLDYLFKRADNRYYINVSYLKAYRAKMR